MENNGKRLFDLAKEAGFTQEELCELIENCYAVIVSEMIDHMDAAMIESKVNLGNRRVLIIRSSKEFLN